MPSPGASRRNLEKGRANWRPPAHYLAPEQRQLVRCVVWWWSTCKGQKPSERALARHIGVSYTYLQLVRKEISTAEQAPNEISRFTFAMALKKLTERSYTASLQ